MLCFHPRDLKIQEKISWNHYVDKWIRVPCGRCVACRRRRQQDWSLRIQHEAEHCMKAGGTCYFITLTYAPEHLKYKVDKDTGEQYDIPSVCPTDPGLFMRKFRKRYGSPCRYFCCGEYGKQFDRPHLHIMLFLSTQETSDSLRPLVEKSWPFGIVKGIYPFSVKLSEYISKYSMKQFGDDYTKKEKPFARMSLKPAIGASYLTDRIKELHRKTKSFVAHDCTGTTFALPRYYRDRIFTKQEIEAQSNSVQRMRYSADLALMRTDPNCLFKRYQANVRFEENLIFKLQTAYAGSNEF